jgi:outer membrane protein OmpA-like peptidoglycan-associated protein
MRYLFIAGGVLLAVAAGCASGPSAAKRAELNEALGFVEAKPDTALVADLGHPAADEIAPQTQPKSEKKTAEQLLVELQARLNTKQRESAAQATLADHAAVRIDYGGIVITLSDSVLFAPEEATLLTSSQLMMGKVAGALLVTKERNLVVEGHTDSNGTAGGNIELSRQRAEAVRTYLIAQGYPAARIRAQGIGQDRPVATNASAKGREKNRRMEIVVSLKRDESL